MTRAVSIATLAVIGWLSFATAHSYRKDGLMIGHLWSKPAGQGEISHLFVPLLNQGPGVDALVAVETPLAERAELWLGEDGRQRLDEMPLEPKLPLSMRPGGRHVKLLDLRKALVPGEKFALTLVFKNAGRVAVESFVENSPYGR